MDGRGRALDNIFVERLWRTDDNLKSKVDPIVKTIFSQQ
jgi:hypothetical protein